MLYSCCLTGLNNRKHYLKSAFYNTAFKTESMKLIAITIIGVLLLAGVGAAATGATTGPAAQPAQPSVYTFDIPATASRGGGTLMINLAAHRFVFDGQGKPGMTYYLQYTIKNQPGIHQFASVTASPSGSVHVEGWWLKRFGTWATKVANAQSSSTLGFAAATPSDNESEPLIAEPTFALSTTTPLYAELHYYPSNAWTHEGNVTIVPVAFGADGSTTTGSTGLIITYECYFRTAYGNHQYNNVVYRGTNIHLTDKYMQLWSDDVSVRTDSAYDYGDLYVYDSLGNSAYDSVDLNHDMSG
jgi:hypothetical protein